MAPDNQIYAIWVSSARDAAVEFFVVATSFTEAINALDPSDAEDITDIKCVSTSAEVILA